MGRNECDASTDNSAFSDLDKMVREGPGEVISEKSNDHIIHSGHFMVSCLQDEADDENENDVKEESTGFDFKSANQTPPKSYEFDHSKKTGCEIIDDSLTKLFKCMSLAYSGKLTSPKWKNFKGLKLTIKDKVRLNNIIWREWHMQYIKGNTFKICMFEPPVADKVHTKAEAVVLEGKYWKRKLASVTAEYQKWRLFHKHRIMSGSNQKERAMMQEVCTHAELLEKIGQSSSGVFRFGQTNVRPAKETPTMDQLMSEDDFMDLSDTLFSTFTGPLNFFPNPRDFGQLSNADIIQPGLLQLQPTIEEEMDTQTLEPLPSLQEMMGGNTFFSSARQSSSNSQSTSMMLDPSSPLADVLFNSENFFADSPQSPPTNTDYSDQFSGQIASNTSNQHASQISDTQVGPTSNNLQSYDDCFQNFITQNNDNVTVDSTNTLNLTEQKSNILQLLSPQHSSSTVSSLTQSLQQQLGGQSDAAVQLLSLIIGNNVGGATTQLQQALNGAGVQQQQQQQILPRQILQLLLQIQQQQSQQQQQQQQETQQLQQQIQQLLQGPQQSSLAQQLQQSQQQPSQGIFQLLQAQKQQLKTDLTVPNTSLSARNQPSQSILQQSQQLNQVEKYQQKDSKVQKLSYPQLHHLLQGQEAQAISVTSSSPVVSPVVTFKQPSTTGPKGKCVEKRSKSVHQVYRQSSAHGLLGTSSTSPQLSRPGGRIRSKSGDTSKKEDPRRSSTGSLLSYKKTRGFLVPQNPVLPYLKKQVNIAPAPAPTSQPSVCSLGGKPSPASQNTFLAQLLTSGESTLTTNFPLKEEKGKVHFANIKPKTTLITKSVAPTTNTVTMATSNKAVPLTTNSFSQYQNLIATNPQFLGLSSTVKISDILNNSTTIMQCNTSNPSSPQQFQVSSPAGSSTESLADRSRHPSNESIGSPPQPPHFTLGSVKEEHTTSPGRGTSRRKTDLDPKAYQEHRRASHINAEQKRRYNIKYGFDTLCQIVPTLTQNPNAKVSKAAILNKSAEYCVKLKADRAEMLSEAELLKQEIESLNQSIQTCQSQLPATGVPVTRQRANQMREKFDEYVKQRTLQNWKFWIFSIVIQPLFDTYNNTVSMATMEDLCRTTLAWLEQHCSLPTLRPGVSNSLLQLNTSTSILSDPSKVPEQAIKAVQMQSLQRQSSDENSR